MNKRKASLGKSNELIFSAEVSAQTLARVRVYPWVTGQPLPGYHPAIFWPDGYPLLKI